MKISALLVLFGLSVFNAFAQAPAEDFKSALMETSGGAMVVYSSNKHSFTFDIVSGNIKPLEQPGYVLVDNKTLQFVIVLNSDFQESADTSLQKKQMLGYMKYELDYIKNDLKMNYHNLKYEWITLNNKIFLLWSYDMPEDMAKRKNATQKQINLSSICFTHAFNLNTPVLRGDNFDEDKGLLLKVAQTYKQNNYKIDFNELYEKLHK